MKNRLKINTTTERFDGHQADFCIREFCTSLNTALVICSVIKLSTRKKSSTQHILELPYDEG